MSGEGGFHDGFESGGFIGNSQWSIVERYSRVETLWVSKITC